MSVVEILFNTKGLVESENISSCVFVLFVYLSVVKMFITVQNLINLLFFSWHWGVAWWVNEWALQTT